MNSGSEMPFEIPSKEVIVGKLRDAFVKVTERDPASINLIDTAKLREDLGLDSFAALELIFELEEMLSVRIPQEAAATFQTVADVVAFVQLQLASPPVAGTP